MRLPKGLKRRPKGPNKDLYRMTTAELKAARFAALRSADAFLAQALCSPKYPELVSNLLAKEDVADRRAAAAEALLRGRGVTR